MTDILDMSGLFPPEDAPPAGRMLFAVNEKGEIVGTQFIPETQYQLSIHETRFKYNMYLEQYFAAFHHLQQILLLRIDHIKKRHCYYE